MEKEFLKSKIKTNLYQIVPDSNVALHKHKGYDEIFYCLKGQGFGILEDKENKMNVGDTFIVKENTMHALSSNSEMWVASILIPVIK